MLLAPHSIAWTDEMFRDIGRAACQVMVDLSIGKQPLKILKKNYVILYAVFLKDIKTVNIQLPFIKKELGRLADLGPEYYINFGGVRFAFKIRILY